MHEDLSLYQLFVAVRVNLYPLFIHIREIPVIMKQWESAAVNTYQFDGIPFNVLIDPQGTIIASSLRGPELESKLAEVLR